MQRVSACSSSSTDLVLVLDVAEALAPAAGALHQPDVLDLSRPRQQLHDVRLSLVEVQVADEDGALVVLLLLLLLFGVVVVVSDVIHCSTPDMYMCEDLIHVHVHLPVHIEPTPYHADTDIQDTSMSANEHVHCTYAFMRVFSSLSDIPCS